MPHETHHSLQWQQNGDGDIYETPEPSDTVVRQVKQCQSVKQSLIEGRENGCAHIRASRQNCSIGAPGWPNKDKQETQPVTPGSGAVHEASPLPTV